VPVAIRVLCPLLQVFDMPTSRRFYRDVLGFAEVSKSGQGDDVLYAIDPDGYELCFQWPVTPTEQPR
jgi:catechol 2,3-dioxygenase-like lactoylglutathione lyase family enzyme